jgi:energy-coupling factor transport system permease protein
VACGLVPAVVFLVSFGAGVTALNPSTDPLSWPTLPLVPALAILVGAFAAVVSPPPVRQAHSSAGPAIAEGDRDVVRLRATGVPR